MRAHDDEWESTIRDQSGSLRAALELPGLSEQELE